MCVGIYVWVYMYASMCLCLCEGVCIHVYTHVLYIYTDVFYVYISFVSKAVRKIVQTIFNQSSSGCPVFSL